MAYMAFRAEMKFYENKDLVDSYYVRSDIEDVLAFEIKDWH